MNTESPDPRDIPILTDAVDKDGHAYALFHAKSVHAAIVTETLKLADTLVQRATQDVEALLSKRVMEELREQLPGLVDRILSERAGREPTGG